jgi:hypothetical protein
MSRQLLQSLVVGAFGLVVVVCPVTALAVGSWSAADSLNLARTSFAAATLTDGSVVVAGGSPVGVLGATSELYDPQRTPGVRSGT